MASLRKAVDEKCKDCIYDHLEQGSWRQQVERCTSEDCALWEHRPITIKSRDAARGAKVIPTKEVA